MNFGAAKRLGVATASHSSGYGNIVDLGNTLPMYDTDGEPIVQSSRSPMSVAQKKKQMINLLKNRIPDLKHIKEISRQQGQTSQPVDSGKSLCRQDIDRMSYQELYQNVISVVDHSIVDLKKK